jgi:uncharacterized protein YyaL (SSP411 family)
MINPDSANRLLGEKSPYLLQHAQNPVDWYPWGEEAFAKARREKKPIFLSIGYSTCHWCHVMAHESFESPATAAIMNREFVNIKVDREERPDVDRVYMTFIQATTGHGGWPMSVWLTPDLQPFVGGTYFPPEERYGQPAFNSVLEKIASAWRRDAEKIAIQGSRIVQALREAQAASRGATEPPDLAVLAAAYEQFSSSYDAQEGGFGTAPKFPHPVALNFLARFYARDRDGEEAKRVLEMHSFTLRRMAAGGMHDHLGGGFHRYSVDRAWHVPHFEKMLYDQAQLAMAYLDGFQMTGDHEDETVVRDVLDYVARDMTSAEGGFFSAEDADSPVPVAAVYDRRNELEKTSEVGAHRAPLQKNAEGAFYVWTKEELDSALGEDREIFAFHYGIQPEGNAPSGSDPHNEFEGKNILVQRHTVGHTAAHFKQSEEKIRQVLGRCRAMLLALRSKRSRPHLDDKIIAAWNGLMISAYARVAAVLGENRYLAAAERAANFLLSELYDGKILYRSYREGRSEIHGFADDYAFVVQGLLDLYEASFDVKWLKVAVELQEAQDRLFLDREKGGYFSTSGNDKNVVLRMKDENDGAEPAPSSVAALNLLRLAQMENRPEWREQAEKTIGAFDATLTRFPSAMPQILVALDFLSSRPRQIVIAGKPTGSDTRALLAEVHRHFSPNKIMLLADEGEGQKYLGQKLEAIRAMKMVEGKAAAYVCENFTCAAPVTDPKVLREMLSR